MKKDLVDKDALYYMQLYSKYWYRIPPQMVNIFLRAGAVVKRAQGGTGWTILENPWKPESTDETDSR